MPTSAETDVAQRRGPAETPRRPPVAVVVPFHGSRAEAAELLALLGTLRRGAGDRVLVADNTEHAVAADLPVPQGVEVLVTQVKRSAYAARNEAIEATSEPWVLLLDADCRPVPDIADRYFDPPPAERTGLLSGGVGGVAGQRGFVAAYARDRRHLDQAQLLAEHVFRPMAVTANVLVRRAAWASVGGFAEGVRSGADGDFCWRLQDAGWELEHRPAAAAPHVHRASVREIVRKAARDGAANPWLARRWPGFPGRVGLARQLVRAAGGVPVWLLRGRPDKAAFKAFDVVWTLAADLGAWGSNAAPRPVPGPGPSLLLAEAPVAGDPRLAATADGALVQALRRPPAVQDWTGARRLDLRLVEDDGPLAGARALLGLLARRPTAVLGALRADPRAALRLGPAAARAAAAGGPVRAGNDVAAEAELLSVLAGTQVVPAT